MAGLDWEKANRKEGLRRRPKGKTRKAKKAEHDRQQAMAVFVFRHNLSCFKCNTTEGKWAKTGFTKRGPWAICKDCVTKR